MVDVGLVIQNSEEVPKGVKNYCEFHTPGDHEIQKCADFKILVQSLIEIKELDNKDIEVLEGKDVCAFEKGIEEESLSGICPCIPKSVLNNWIVEEISISNAQYTYIVLKPGSNRDPFVKRSLDINDMSDTAVNSKSPFDQYMCPKEPQDFEDDRDCNLSPDLLRMVE
ncbi:trans-resveratrol di-O-methyltransferase-like [Gossypium australe]|uniref:Trans-resveratrol di-O-methyltransferase-like n=1 Tax=Gossypium australe TaxID=47621 RepID=A0A5B6VKW1_9ROSI|nr:trans-resveratrol di-O-methyltransferase-like [Gossypium australe]